MRLNPFAFPSETDFRFAQLVVATLGASIVVFTMAYNSVPGIWEWKQAEYQRCYTAVQAAYPGDTATDIIDRVAAHGACTAPTDRVQTTTVGGAVLLLAALIATLYWLLPRWKRWRADLVPLREEDDPELLAALRALSHEAGLREAPEFVWNPLNLAINGLAFGRRGRYYLALSGGLAVQYRIDPPAFRAVLLHELAHLHNGDVDKTYLALASGVAYVVAVIVPYVLTMIGKSWAWVFQLSWRALAITALVYVTLCALLRARELYADARASLLDGPHGALRRVLAAQPSRPHLAGGPRAWLTHVWALFSVHPDADRRVRALGDTTPLFQFGFWAALGTGIAASLSFQDVSGLVASVTLMSAAFLRPLGAALIFAPLAVGVVGLGVWRAAFAALARGELPRGAGRLGVAVGLGLLMGRHLSFTSFAVARSEAALPLPERAAALTGTPLLVFELMWGAVLLLGLYLFLQWIAAGATVWLEVAERARSPRRAYRVGLALAGVLLTGWLAVMFYVDALQFAASNDATLRPFIPALEDLGLPITAIANALASAGLAVADTTVLFVILTIFAGALVLVSPFTLGALVSVWGYPLAAWFWLRNRPQAGDAPSAAGARWALLDPNTDPPHWPRQDSLRPGQAALIGAIFGVLAAGFTAIVNPLLLYGPLGSGATGLFTLWALAGQPVVSIAAQLAAAAVAAARISRLSTLHALLAAFVAGLITTGGVLWFNLAAWGDTNAGFAWTLTWVAVGWALNGGGLLSLGVGFVVAALARRRRAPLPLQLRQVPSEAVASLSGAG